MAANVSVKDLVALSAEPPTVDNHPSPYLAVQMAVSIQLVTDSYMEVIEYEPGSVMVLVCTAEEIYVMRRGVVLIFYQKLSAPRGPNRPTLPCAT
ncbi:hypothetical protein DXG01_014281 [Tephrocybe rancida]|nr:hypothetical protein DXG01_014281 [Tephrocybe rancida]